MENTIPSSWHFDKPGISYIFCNIHPEMSAVVIAVETPYYGISDARGQVVIPKVPTGRYTLRVWYEAALPETLRALVQEINISENSSSIGVLRVPEDRKVIVFIASIILVRKFLPTL
jgi:hypothetical protein